MRALLKNRLFNRTSRRAELTSHYLDSPAVDQTISRPELLITGWLVFSRPPADGTLEVTFEAGSSRLSVSLQSRPDVEATYTDRHCVGFSLLVDLIKDIDSSNSEWQNTSRILVNWSDGSLELPLQLQLADGFNTRESYFKASVRPEPTPALSQEQIESWQKNGFLLLKGFNSTDEIDAINSDIDNAWSNRDRYPDTITVDQHIGSRVEKRLPLAATDPSVRESPYKLNDFYLESDAIRRVVLSDRLLEVLAPLIGGTPMICNSLSFEYGSQQEDHFDTFFMPPRVRYHMLATWVALEDVHPDAGPLRYYPGSHELEPFRTRDGTYNMTSDQRAGFDDYIAPLIAESGLQPETFCAEKGDVFIWHAHLFHGGSAINDKSLTRKSLVTHYFCQEDWSPEDYEEFAPGRAYLRRD